MTFMTRCDKCTAIFAAKSIDIRSTLEKHPRNVLMTTKCRCLKGGSIFAIDGVDIRAMIEQEFRYFLMAKTSGYVEGSSICTPVRVDIAPAIPKQPLRKLVMSHLCRVVDRLGESVQTLARAPASEFH